MADEPPSDSYVADVLSFVCPRCGAVSYNPTDRADGYCARCHDWTRDGVPGPTTGPPSDALTIVIRLPQPLDKVNALLRALADEWPDATFRDGLAYLEIPASE